MAFQSELKKLNVYDNRDEPFVRIALPDKPNLASAFYASAMPFFSLQVVPTITLPAAPRNKCSGICALRVRN
jgi:hypothetical protein